MNEQRTSTAASIDDARYAAAADWLQRLDQPELAEEEVQAWLVWFGASDLNRKAFEEASVLHQRLRNLPEAYRRELQARVEPVERRRRHAVAPRWYRMVGIAAALCLLAPLPGTDRITRPAPATETLYTAPVNGFRTVVLEDGSSLVLGADATVAVDIDAQRRLLDIRRGDAYFEVRRDPDRPFVVRAAGVKVTAVGTAFRVSRQADRVVVTVTEGTVEVDQGTHKVGTAARDTAPLKLRVGQRKELPLVSHLDRSVNGRPSAAPAWDGGRVEFVNTPLREVLTVVNSYAPTRIVIDDPRVEELTYSGTVERNHIDEWTASLPQIYRVRAVTLDDGTVTLVSERGAVLP